MEKKKPQNLVLTFSVCVEIGRQNSVLGERREKRTRTRGNSPSDLCRLWAPPKSEKVKYWDVGHTFEILEPNKNFQFWVFSEIEFWEMSDEWWVWVMCFEFMIFEFWDTLNPNTLLFSKDLCVHVSKPLCRFLGFSIFPILFIPLFPLLWGSLTPLQDLKKIVEASKSNSSNNLNHHLFQLPNLK